MLLLLQVRSARQASKHASAGHKDDSSWDRPGCAGEKYGMSSLRSTLDLLQCHNVVLKSRILVDQHPREDPSQVTSDAFSPGWIET